MAYRLLVVDAYPREGREKLIEAGGTEAGILYSRMIERIHPGMRIKICHPADGARPTTDELQGFDGAAWTGSNLSILDDDPRVVRQIDLARELIEEGVPNFGSCFAIQVATVALGGRCTKSPRGREFGISRAIQLTPAGREHLLYRGKPDRFDAFTSHADEVAVLPGKSELLAGNEWSSVQGASLEGGHFLAVQYHPEYDLHEVASLCRLRKDELVEQGTFADLAEAERMIQDFEALHADPTRDDLAKSLGVGETLLDEDVRTLEVRNWLDEHTPLENPPGRTR